MVILIAGGASSGKSKIAEDICLKLGEPLYYIATMKDDCAESKRKIKGHRLLRKDKGFETIEKPCDLGDISFPKKGTALLECLGNLLSNEMFKDEIILDSCDKIIKDIEDLLPKNRNTVIVSNDLFSNLEGLNKESLAYVKNLAYLNKELAKRADVVIEAVCSLPNIIKGEDICRSSDIF